MILGLFGAEYERRISDTTSWGVVGSSWGVVGTTWGIRLTEGATFRRYRSLQVLARYHPQEAAPSGFYVGVQGGLHVMDDDRRPGIGVELGETRFFGREERFSFGSGFGFTRVLGGRSAGLVLKSARINVGLAF